MFSKAVFTLHAISDISLQVLNNVHGLRAFIDRLTAPDVTVLKVWRWASEKNEDKVTEDALRIACPNAEIHVSIDPITSQVDIFEEK